ncbi:hypothetical protein [Oleisolibacter albus]|uniref:hypothetical protein n=1 Tax=Oleisolibacter albus TaxID=2171757 RepID=UPI0012D76A59|nr:hypothetical protein [Oleisolibacter albus]
MSAPQSLQALLYANVPIDLHMSAMELYVTMRTSADMGDVSDRDLQNYLCSEEFRLILLLHEQNRRGQWDAAGPASDAGSAGRSDRPG